jgi:CubicO group peptidase (beta-lactamase class C family)
MTPPSSAPAAGAGTALGVFAPRAADPQRKSKLAALAPQLDALYRARSVEAGASGAAVGIVMDGELVYAGFFGERDVETHAPVDIDTVFRVGSLTKSFTATAILQLRDRGLLSLDSPAKLYVPAIASFRGMPPDAPAITVRHLLTMTSGLAYDDTWGPVTFGYDDQRFDRFIQSGVPLASPPGERFAYSNLGYALLGKIVERVSGRSFRDYVSANVLAPLGMASSGWTASRERLAVGYHRRDNALLPEPRPDDGAFAPAGGLYSSLRDYARYMAFQLSAHGARDAPEVAPLQRSSVREMHGGYAWMRWGDDVPVATRRDGRLFLMASSYGFGWVNHTTCAYEGLVQHGGYEPGYFAYMRLLPKDRIAFVTFSTTAAIGDFKTFEAALSLLRGAGLLDTNAPIPPALTRASASVNQLLGRWDPRLATEVFDPDSLKYSFFATIEQDFARLSRDHGACKPAGPLVAPNPTQARWRVACERGAIRFNLWLNPAPEPQVQLVRWEEEPATATTNESSSSEHVVDSPCKE